MAFCSKCGAQIQDGVAFCPQCGAAVGNAQPQYQQPQYQQPAQPQYQQPQYQQPAQPQYSSPDQDIQANKGIAWLGYMGFLFFIPLVARPQSKYCRFHANQGLVLFLLELAGYILCAIISAIITPSYYGIPIPTPASAAVSGILYAAISIFVCVLAIMGIVNACGGKVKQLPLIGKIKLLK